MDKPKDIVYDIYEYHGHALNDFKEFLKVHDDEVEKASRAQMYIRLKNGETYWFLTETQFNYWAYGRTYDLFGETYRSGYLVEVKADGSDS
jgi:uncharacterized protein YdbL (DUF1318 family)